MRPAPWWLGALVLLGCGRGPATLDVYLDAPGPDALQLASAPSHVDLRRPDGSWLRLPIREPPDLTRADAERVVLTRAAVPPGRYVAVRVGYVVAVPRPDLAPEPEDDELDTAVPMDVVAGDDWVMLPFCVGRGADLHLVVEPDPANGGRTPRFDVASAPPC